MTLALILFVLFYILMLAVQQYRPWVALGGAGTFLLLGKLGVYDFTLADAARAVDFNVLLMMAGMMGTVFLFIQSKMPARLAEELIAHMPDVRWAVSVLALLAGFISAFVDNVATVLMVAPVGLAIARRLRISPVPVLIAIAVSSNLQGAATLVGDTTSILLAGHLGLDFMDFFAYRGRPGLFWVVQAGALMTVPVMLFLFRKEKGKLYGAALTPVTDYLPTCLLLGTVLGGGMVIALMLCYVKLTGISDNVSSIKREISALEEQHIALLTEYERTFDLAAVKAAAEAAGMSKPSSSQIYYIDLSEGDSAVVYQQEESNLLSRLLTSLNHGIYAVVEYFD